MRDSITLDEIRDLQTRTPWVATTDQGGSFNVIARTDAGVIVRGVGTGIHARIVQTGRVRRNGQVRVRFEFARDTEDWAGTFAFDSTRTSGLTPADTFAH